MKLISWMSNLIPDKKNTWQHNIDFQIRDPYKLLPITKITTWQAVHRLSPLQILLVGAIPNPQTIFTNWLRYSVAENKKIIPVIRCRFSKNHAKDLPGFFYF